MNTTIAVQRTKPVHDTEMPPWFAFLTDDGGMVEVNNTGDQAKLGQGGMGTVYRGTYTNSDGVETGSVAVKRARDIDADGHFLCQETHYARRVASTAEAAKQESGVPRIIDQRTSRMGELGRLIISELMTGNCLYNLIYEKRIPRSTALGITGDLLQTLMHMEHSEGYPEGPIVHIDMKPGNIYYDRATGRVWLYDFGLARGQKSPARYPGQTCGTPIWMPPEQCLNLEATDVRTNVFQLGLILADMATEGRYSEIRENLEVARNQPFSGREHIADNIAGQYLKYIQQAVSDYDYLHPWTPIWDDLKAVIYKATAFYPRDRYQNAQEMYDDMVARRLIPAQKPAPVSVPA